MQRILRHVPAGLVLLACTALAACFGGSGSTSRNGFASTKQFLVNSCTLGCSAGSCAATSIAVNQDVTFFFNDRVDRATVSFTTIEITEKLTGTTPPGDFLVTDNRVTFRPALLETSSGILFGFEDGADYEVKLFALPESNVIRSTIGRPNQTPIQCTIRTEGIKDLVPGRPRVSFTPSASAPPTSTSFEVVMVFNDLMEKGQLVDPVTKDSPTVNVVILDEFPGQTVETQMPGTFSAVLNRDLLTTTLTFTPLTRFPGNGGVPVRRSMRLDFSSQIRDLAGMTLENAGSYVVPLPDSIVVPGSIAEAFGSPAQMDPESSSLALWGGPGGAQPFVDSGLDPVDGSHQGGGSGALGVFRPQADIVLNTDSHTFAAGEFETVLGRDVTVNGGVFMFESVHIPLGVTVSATGSKPLRLFARGEFVVEGVLDVSGADAAVNFGKYFPPNAENLTGEDQTNMTVDQADGGPNGVGRASGGSGGRGGASLYLVGGYYDENLNSWQSGFPDPNRFTHGILTPEVHGRMGQGIGGRPSLGHPTSPSAVTVDRSHGAGVGSMAWPLKSDVVPNANNTLDFLIRSHLDPGTLMYQSYALHRSYGGGGGGFWTKGDPGTFFDAAGTDPLGAPLVMPTIDPGRTVWEYNSVFAYNAGAGGGTPDGGEGILDYALYPGIETLDPDGVTPLLLGGAGGGGAGQSQHGSYNDSGPDASGLIETYRTNDGGGGGAGGGAAQIHASRRLAIAGRIDAFGGDGGSSKFMQSIPYAPANAITFGPPGDAGGGGGAGGAVLVEVNGALGAVGPEAIDVNGGAGGIGAAGNHGGAGGAGLVRFQTATGGESLAALQGLVTPDIAVDLDPIGAFGVPNVGVFDGINGGTSGDLSFTSGLGSWTFDGNSSGVRSLWYEAPVQYTHLSVTDFTVTVQWWDGIAGSPVFETYNTTNLPSPGNMPFWIAFQTGFGFSTGGPVEPAIENPWVIPGFDAADNGLAGIQAGIWRMLRWQLVFDQDEVAARIGNDPAAYYRITQVRVDYVAE
ncbi:MAG TPA: Ig-like domain-containing protein [Planctomycetota bacterium]